MENQWHCPRGFCDDAFDKPGAAGDGNGTDSLSRQATLHAMLLELTDDDFDAYGAGRARATALTRPRGTVKRRMLAWAASVAEALAGEGIEVEVGATDEHPSSRNGHQVEAESVFLFRGAAARRAMRLALGSLGPKEDDGRPELGHARVELRVDAGAVSLLLWLGADARIDLESTLAVLEQAWPALPAGARVAARPSLSDRAQTVEELSLAEAAQIARDALDAEVPLVVGFRIPRARAVEAGALEPLFERALALGRFLSAVGWSPENAALKARAPRDRPSFRRSRRVRHERVERPQPPPAIERGDRVLALAGPFAGQSGVVQELDGKGGARVLFGLLAARVEVRDLTTAAAKRGRALISSSHRKPGS